MAATVRTSITLPITLNRQITGVARALGLSRSQLVDQAVAEFIQRHQDQPSPTDNAPSAAQRVIHQGDLYWVQLSAAGGAEPGVRHPHVVIQDDVFNHSRITTVVACALTSNLKRAKAPGNVLLEAGEGRLEKPSVVEVSKVSTLAKTELGEYIGSLTARRIDEILAGMRFLQRAFMPGP